MGWFMVKLLKNEGKKDFQCLMFGLINTHIEGLMTHHNRRTSLVRSARPVLSRIIWCIAPKSQGLLARKCQKKDQNFFCKALAMSESLTCLARDRLKRLRIGPLDAILFDVVVEMLSADI